MSGQLGSLTLAFVLQGRSQKFVLGGIKVFVGYKTVE